MPVRLRKVSTKKGTTQYWTIDIYYRYPDGRDVRVREKSPDNSQRGAKAREKEIITALATGTYVFPDQKREGEHRKEPEKPITFKEFSVTFMAYSDANNKPSTAYAKKMMLKNHLGPVFDSTPLEKIGAEAIEVYKAKALKSGVGAKTLSNHLICLRKLLNLAEEYGRIVKAPKVKMVKFQRPKMEFLLDDEADRVLRVVEPEWLVMTVLALKTGLRLGELLALKWEDVDLLRKQLVVRSAAYLKLEGTPKSGGNREVPLPDSAVVALRSHKHLKGPYVFCQASGARFEHRHAQEVIHRALRKAGIAKRLSWHGLRHTFGRALVIRGQPLKVVAELLGHADTHGVTERYSHLTPDIRRDAVATLDVPVGQFLSQGRHSEEKTM